MIIASLHRRASHPSPVTMMRASLFLLVAAISTANIAGEYVAVMDLSYKPNLSATKISTVVREILDKKDRRPNALELDVSFSEVGNEGIVTLIQTLLNITESVPLGLSLASRMNRLTPDGVSKMLNSILGDESNGDADKGNLTGGQSSLVLRSMDLGWNNLGPDQTGSKELSSSLRRLVESENCPNVLRLYQCGLGPAACRAIGKVCAL